MKKLKVFAVYLQCYFFLITNHFSTMKKMLSVFCLLALAFTSFGQDADESDKGYIGLAVGAAVPFSDFASTDAANTASGYAKTGYVAELNAGVKLYKALGLAASFRIQGHSMDAQAFADDVAALSNPRTLEVTAGGFGLAGFLVGPYVSTNLSKKVAFDGKATFGFLSSVAPTINAKGTRTDGSAFAATVESGTGTGFAINLGVGLRFNLSRRFCLTLGGDYMTTNASYKDAKTTSNGTTSKTEFKQIISSTSLTLGIGYRL